MRQLTELRYLVLAGQRATNRMLADMLRVLGAENIVIETDGDAATALLRDFDPQLIVTEYRTAKIDGVAFTRQLRHSRLSCKAVPVLMVKAEVTVDELREARNAGVHEVLRKPFDARSLIDALVRVSDS